jgi:hypothetical protein
MISEDKVQVELSQSTSNYMPRRRTSSPGQGSRNVRPGERSSTGSSFCEESDAEINALLEQLGDFKW